MKNQKSFLVAFLLKLRTQHFSLVRYLFILKNILISGKGTVENIKAIYKDPKEAIQYFEDKVLFQNTVTTIRPWYEDKSPKSNLFGKTTFFANTMEEMKRDSYILLLLKGIDPQSLTDLEIALDIIDYDGEDNISYQILFRYGYNKKETFEEVTEYNNPFVSPRAA